MATVEDLLPGDLVTAPDGTAAVFLAACPHPVWHHLLLVIWRMEHDDSIGLGVMHPQQETGDVQPIEPGARANRLMAALPPTGLVMEPEGLKAAAGEGEGDG